MNLKFLAKVFPCTIKGERKKIEDFMPDEWEVEKILRHRKINGKWEFLTKWVGYEPGEETWEPVQNVIHSSVLSWLGIAIRGKFQWI